MSNSKSALFTEGVSFEVQLFLANQELGPILNSCFVLSARVKVNTTIGNEDAAKAATEELVKFQAQATAWQDIIKDIEKEQRRVETGAVAPHMVKAPEPDEYAKEI